MDKPVPTYTDEDLRRIVVRDYPAEATAEVLASLDYYGEEQWHREPLRVRMACLKCANGNFEKLTHYINMAGEDYRDILLEAEYPTYLKANNEAAKKLAVESDWAQLQAWLKK